MAPADSHWKSLGNPLTQTDLIEFNSAHPQSIISLLAKRAEKMYDHDDTRKREMKHLYKFCV